MAHTNAASARRNVSEVNTTWMWELVRRVLAGRYTTIPRKVAHDGKATLTAATAMLDACYAAGLLNRTPAPNTTSQEHVRRRFIYTTEPTADLLSIEGIGDWEAFNGQRSDFMAFVEEFFSDDVEKLIYGRSPLSEPSTFSVEKFRERWLPVAHAMVSWEVDELFASGREQEAREFVERVKAALRRGAALRPELHTIIEEAIGFLGNNHSP